jgi:rhodanese-related sulfurtransferase
MSTDEHRISADRARVLIASGEATALDVRKDEQWLERRVPAATHVEEDDLSERIEELPDEGQIIVISQDGERSEQIAEKLRERGLDAVSIEGGMEAWEKEQFPMQPSTDPDEDVRV